MLEFALHDRLKADTLPIADLRLSKLLLMNDSQYPWVVLVPRVVDVSEIIDLSESQRNELMSEVALVSRILKDITRCDKLNVAALGNITPQLHVHVVARFKGDAAWPNPVFGKFPPQAYDPSAAKTLITRLQHTLRPSAVATA